MTKLEYYGLFMPFLLCFPPFDGCERVEQLEMFRRGNHTLRTLFKNPLIHIRQKENIALHTSVVQKCSTEFHRSIPEERDFLEKLIVGREQYERLSLSIALL